MLQRIFALAIILVCILWLVISYVPGLQTFLPTLALVEYGNGLAMLGAITLVIFLAIQLWLVFSTVSTVRAHTNKGDGSPFRLKLGAELFWTALPVAMTVGLAWASYALWVNLGV